MGTKNISNDAIERELEQYHRLFDNIPAEIAVLEQIAITVRTIEERERRIVALFKKLRPPSVTSMPNEP